MSDKILAARRTYLEALDNFTDAFSQFKERAGKRQESEKATRKRAGEQASRHGAGSEVASRLRGGS